jgi:hypothetical protein
MPDDLSDDDKAILAELLRDTIAADRFPLSPRIRRLKAILDKLRAAGAASGANTGAEPPGERSMVLTKKRRR